MTEQKRIVGYARVSTENQTENYSIDQQTERLSAYCQARDWALLGIYIDAGFSGGSPERPALKQLLTAVAAGGVDAVLVCKLDRLSRSQKDTLTLIEDGLLAHGTDFISISESFDTATPFGRAMIGMLSVFAQLEKDQITERFTMGRVGRGQAGYFHGGGCPPTGYDYRDGLLVPKAYEAMQIQEAYRLFLAGESVNAVAHRLTERFGRRWTAAKVLSALKNSVYVGKVKFLGREYDGVHEPLIAPEDFRRAAALLDFREKEHPIRAPYRRGYLLSGLLRCGRCGAAYHAGHGCYRCYSRSGCSPQYVRDPSCRNKNWPISQLDEAVTTEVFALLSAAAPVDALPERFERLETPQQRALLSALIKHIDLDGESVTVHWRL